MRFSLYRDNEPGNIHDTLLLNLSETGLAFLVKPGFEPNLGDRIKVEIPIPNGDQMAWFARVVRVQEYQTSRWALRKNPETVQKQILVGLTFEALPVGHSKSLRHGIELSFINAAREQKYRTAMYYKTLMMHHLPKALLYFALLVGAIGFIYYFSQPDGNYDAKRGTPWGERFKF